MSLPGLGSLIPAPAEAEARRDGDGVWERWTAGFPHLAAYRTARSALAALLRARGVRRVWLPAYVCAAVLEAARAAGAEPCWYPVGLRLEDGAEALADAADEDAALVVAFFGRPPPAAIAALAARRPDVLWIEDRAQALAPGSDPVGGVALYSPRKLFGVGDGGLLVSRDPLPQPRPQADDPALWAPNLARADDPGGATPERWFPSSQAREAGFAVDDAPMGARTRQALAALSFTQEAQARRRNWRVLAERLASLALWPDAESAFAPLAYPVLVDDAASAARRLAEERIWCARHWAAVPSPADRFPEAHALAARCLSLPLDGRYGPAEMERLAEAVLRLQPR